MKKVTVALAAALAALAVGATTQGSAHAATAHATTTTPQTFADPAGDSGTAPDITGLSVGNDQTGDYQFAVTFATDYATNAYFGLYVDTDKNPATGDPNADGADYAIFDDHASHSFEVDSWNGTDWATASDQTASFTIAQDSRSLTIAINKSELGNTTDFNFFVLSGDGTDPNAHVYDDAPSGSGTFAYTYQQQTLTLAFVATKSVIKGRTWAIVASIRRSDTNDLQGSDGTIACHSKLPVLMHAWLSPGGANTGAVAVCEFQLPKPTKKKRHVAVTATMTIGADGATVSKTVDAKS